jgi:hypothetical protein
MADNDPLEDLSRYAVRFPGPTLPLAGLRTALVAVEEQLEHARAQATIRLSARHNRDPDLHPDDRDLDLYELKVTVEQVLPHVFRGGFVLTLWSVFEVVAIRMAKYAAIQKAGDIAPFQWKQKPRETFLDVLDRVYSTKLGIRAFPDRIEREQLDQLRELRNVLIHHNGSVDGFPDSLRAASSKGYAALGLDHYTDLHDEFVIPNAQFLRCNFELVERYLASLSERAYEAAHPTP